MAGVKGRSGGARPNTGGARPGAGRPPGPKKMPAYAGEHDMLEILQKVAMGELDATPLQVRAAIAAVQYTHVKRCDGGKKEDVAEKAEKASAGKFGVAEAPRLVASGGKSI